MEFEIPQSVPVMTLSNIVLFPQAMLPLHIFEPRYREMLQEVLQNGRMFAVACMDDAKANATGEFEPPFPTATVGVIRACQGNPDGTSNLLLQGLQRVRVASVEQETPYRIITVEPLESLPGATLPDVDKVRETITAFAEKYTALLSLNANQVLEILQGVEQVEEFIDLAIFYFCTDAEVKQAMLETLEIDGRYHLLLRYLRSEIVREEIRLQFEDGIDDDQFSVN